MNCSLFLILVLAGVCTAERVAPYQPSGWRPEGRAFNLPLERPFGVFLRAESAISTNDVGSGEVEESVETTTEFLDISTTEEVS